MLEKGGHRAYSMQFISITFRQYYLKWDPKDNQIVLKDEDGKISLHEMRIVLSLFLPVNIQQEQENVESTIYSMDSRRDGEIRLQDFVKGVREVGSFKLAR